jgi:hypothetical protein
MKYISDNIQRNSDSVIIIDLKSLVPNLNKDCQLSINYAKTPSGSNTAFMA